MTPRDEDLAAFKAGFDLVGIVARHVDLRQGRS
jgi:hypothetical protein